MSPLVHLALVLLAQSPERVTLIFGGDLIPHGGVKAAAAAHAVKPKAAVASGEVDSGGWEHVLGPLSGELRAADIAVVNLESPLTSLKRPETGAVVFSAGPSLAVGLREAGVAIATFANNHCLDQHEDGIVSTRESLEQAGLRVAGAGRTYAEAWEPVRVQGAGLNVCIFAFTRWLNGFKNPTAPAQPHVPVVSYASGLPANGISVDELVSKVAAIAPTCDALFVIAHWGKEYGKEPKPEDRVLARRLLDAGALGIVGHHPHVLQEIERLSRRDGGEGFVAYSLGNLLSNQAPGMPESNRRDGALLEVELARDAAGAPVRIAHLTALPLFTSSWREKGERNLQELVLDEEIATAQVRLEGLSYRRDRASKAESRALGARLASMTKRKARIVNVLKLERPAEATATARSGG